MKKYITPQANGGLRYKNEDFIEIFQTEPYKAKVAILKGLYGNGSVIIQGCNPTLVSPGNITISEGYILMNGDIHYFAGTTNCPNPFYLVPDTSSFLSRIFKNLVSNQAIVTTKVKVQSGQPTSGGWISGDDTGMTDNENGDGINANGGGGSILNGSIYGLIPSGIITMWSGAIGDIPFGWALCDGTASTPDLRNRFIVGAGNTYAVGDTGGTDTTELLEHKHTGDGNIAWSINGSALGSFSGAAVGVTTGTDAYIYAPTDATGGTSQISVGGADTTNTGNVAPDNRPPYYALAYIMKL